MERRPRPEDGICLAITHRNLFLKIDLVKLPKRPQDLEQSHLPEVFFFSERSTQRVRLSIAEGSRFRRATSFQTPASIRRKKDERKQGAEQNGHASASRQEEGSRDGDRSRPGLPISSSDNVSPCPEKNPKRDVAPIHTTASVGTGMSATVGEAQ